MSKKTETSFQKAAKKSTKNTKITVATVLATAPVEFKNAKHNKSLPLQKASRSEMVRMINGSQGRFFTCTHIDKNGDSRTMNAIKSNRIQETPSSDLGYITVYSMLDKGYRNINPQTITDLSMSGVHYAIKIKK
jgi:hypothetical protein